MKKLLLPILSVMLCLSLCSCVELTGFDFKQTKPIVGVICADFTEMPIASPALSDKDEANYITLYVNADKGDVNTAMQSLITQGAQIITASTADFVQASELILLAKADNIPLILLGAQPSPDALDSYDKVWYLGASATNGGEVLGLAAAEHFKSGDIADANGDGILQPAFVECKGTDISDSAVNAAADLGVYSNPVISDACSTVETSYTASAKLLSENADIELIICDSAHSAGGAQLALNDAGKSVPIVAMGNKEQLTALSLENKLLAFSAYPNEQILAAAKSFIGNIIKGEAIINNTELKLSEHKTILFPYGNVGK